MRLVLGILISSVFAASLLTQVPQNPPSIFTDAQSLQTASASTQYATCSGPVITTTGAFTISAWFYATQATGKEQALISQDYRNIPGNSPVDSTFELTFETDVSGATLYMYAYAWSGSSGQAYLGQVYAGVTKNAWHQVVYVYDGTSTATTYLDGSTSGMSAFAGGSWAGLHVSSHPMYFGAEAAVSGFGRYWDGYFDNIQFWEGMGATSGQVTALYNSGTIPNIYSLSSFSSMTNWWPVGEYSDTTSTLYDKKGAINCTTSGSPSFSGSIP